MQLFNVLKQNYHQHKRHVYRFLTDLISHTLLCKLPQKYVNKQFCKHIIMCSWLLECISYLS